MEKGGGSFRDGELGSGYPAGERETKRVLSVY